MTPEKKRLRVGILFGGRSGEHEVSLASAASVIRGLDPDKYEAVPIGITKEGHWLVGNAAQKMLPEVLKSGQRVMMTADPTDAAPIPLDRGGSGGGITAASVGAAAIITRWPLFNTSGSIFCAAL